MLPSESKYFGMAKDALESLRNDFEIRYQFSGRSPTDAMVLRYAGYCLDVAFAEAGFVPERFLAMWQSAASPDRGTASPASRVPDRDDGGAV